MESVETLRSRSELLPLILDLVILCFQSLANCFFRNSNVRSELQTARGVCRRSGPKREIRGREETLPLEIGINAVRSRPQSLLFTQLRLGL